ncbi:carboxy terminal-processing peptidase [Kiritimatiellaeota bacterium B1221]|nr:carboxy terminal-processing peptidase [Kiritimatiellaeota bacterium B1221]
MKLFSSLLFAGLLIHGLILSAEEIQLQANATQVTRLVTHALPASHLSHQPLSESLMRRTLDNFLRSLDYDRSLFMAEDVVALRKQAMDMQADLERGDVSIAYETFELLKERAANRVAYVDKLLEQGFDLEVDEDYVWRRKDAAWSANEAEWDELWRKKVKNEYIGLLVSQKMRELDAEEEAAEKAAKALDDVEVEVEESPGVDEVEIEAEVEVEVDVKSDIDLSPEERIRKRYTQFMEVLNGHDSEYVLGMYLSSLASAYDAHSSYLSPRREEDFDIQMRLSLTGIGAELTYDEGAAKINKVMKGGPADMDGRLQSGDKIIAVQQKGEEPVDILYWPLYKSVRLIRGPIGSTVILHVIPASDATGTQVRLIEIVRDEIKLEEKEAKSMVYDLEKDEKSYKLGIINLPDFYADFNGGKEATSSAADVKRLLEGLNEEGVDGLVLDLRNNGGGSLRDCVDMTGLFIESGVVVQVKSGQRVSVMMDPDDDILFDKPMVVLVNKLSASASEILAAALQDYGRAVIVGDSKTHGKGTVQSLMPLDRKDESMGALKVTTAGFYRVDGRSTQLKGVSPDIVIRTPTDVMELGEEYLPNVLPWSWVAPISGFPAYGDLRETNEKLLELSRARLEQNEKFHFYQDKVDRLAERVQRLEVSLNFESRLDQMKADRELDKLQDKGLVVADENPDDEEDEEMDEAEIQPEKDMILKEGLEILADLIALTA